MTDRKYLTVTPSLHQQLADEAHRSGQTITALVTIACHRELLRRRRERRLQREMNAAARRAERITA